MRQLQALGFGGMAAALTPLSPAAEMALDCWGFCGGWKPPTWAVYEALHPVPDWHHHIELLRVIRATLREIDSRPP
jgi:hypothetical protein